LWPSEIEEFIGGIELWKGLTGEELRLLIDCFEVKTFGPDSLLFEENSSRSELFVVVEGEVELFKTNTFEEERRLSVFRGGDFLGESSLVDDSPHSTSARTLKETKTLVLSRKVFRGLVKENGSIALKVFPQVARVISRRMHQANTRVVTAGAQYESGRTRMEHDLLGEREVPDEIYYGIQTLRAQENFDITGVNLSHFPVLIKALAMVKMAAARANHDLGLLPTPVADAIAQACREIVNGRHHYNFVVDMIQGGAGTSTNMNANEVIANRALEILGHDRGDYEHCHPNNHVNLSQSTNDVYPTAVKIALIDSNGRLVQVLHGLVDALRGKGREFSRVLKMGRTQLQDAVPMTLGQEFEAYAVTMGEEIQRLEENARLFLEVNMGGTAIGTGITADPEYGGSVLEHLREITGLDLVLAPDLVEQTQDTGAFVMYSSAIKRLAVKLSKISNDLRLLSSGPRAGIHEINLPPVQPGSSIMPGKVNPVIPEVVNQIAFKVIGNDLTVTLAAEAGQLQLNVMEPVITQSLFESIEMLERGMQTLTNRCIMGITANEERARRMVEGSIGLVTALVPVLGYEACSRLAREAMDEGRGIYELVLERELLSKEELDRLLDPENMVRPRKL
jgi:aspartate ammonia-lyase